MTQSYTTYDADTIAKNIFQKMKQVVDQMSGSSEAVSTTLSAASWTGTGQPYAYDLGAEYADKNIVIGYDATRYSDDSYDAATYADITGGSGRVLYCCGEKPTVDIPVILFVV